jgi:hypothetical protein
MGTPSHSSYTTVHLEKARERTGTIVGWPLFGRLLRRVLFSGAVAGTAGILGWISVATLSRPLASFVVLFGGMWLATLTLYGGALISDYQEKRRLTERYGLTIRFGLDTYQQRTVRIESPPADLASIIVRALEAIPGDAKVRQIDAQTFEARLRRKGNQLQCRVNVQARPDGPDAMVVSIESQLTEPLGFVDYGRNIVNVEEFQLELRRLLEGESSSEREKRSPPG